VPHSEKLDPDGVLLAGRAAAESGKIATLIRQMGMNLVYAPTMASVRQIVRENRCENFLCAMISEDIEGKPGLECAAWMLQQDSNLSCMIVADNPCNDLLIKSLRLGICDAVAPSSGPEELRRSLERAIRLTNFRRGSHLLTKRIQEASNTYHRLVSGKKNPHELNKIYGYDVRAETSIFPALEEGGDFGSAFPLDDHRIILLGGDISGHEVSGGLLSTFMMGLGRGMFFRGADSYDIRRHINDFLIKEWNSTSTKGEILVSLAVATVVLDFDKLRIECLCNGFPQAIMCDDKLEISLLGSSNPPLGWFDVPIVKPETIPMPEAGCVVMFSDGLEELYEGRKAHLLSIIDRLLCQSFEEAQCSGILDHQRDDIFVQRFAWAKSSQENDNLIRPIFHNTCQWSDIEEIDICQERWLEIISKSLPGLARERLAEIVLCCREAVLNALEHGCQTAERKCAITMALVGRNILRIRVRAPATNTTNSTEKESGHIPFGLKIIKGYSNSYHYDRMNNNLLLDFLLTSPDKGNPPETQPTLVTARNLP
jgi:hypothetical protein